MEKRISIIMTERVSLDMDSDSRFAGEIATTIYRFIGSDCTQVYDYQRHMEQDDNTRIVVEYVTTHGRVIAEVDDCTALDSTVTIMYADER